MKVLLAKIHPTKICREDKSNGLHQEFINVTNWKTFIHHMFMFGNNCAKFAPTRPRCFKNRKMFLNQEETKDSGFQSLLVFSCFSWLVSKERQGARRVNPIKSSKKVYRVCHKQFLAKDC